MDDTLNIITRNATLEDKNFIFSTWLKGNYFGNFYFGEMPQDLYFSEYAAHITKVLQNPHTRITIACSDDQPNWLVGFSVYQGHVLHWVYVKKDYRRKGVATLMLKDKNIHVVTNLTGIGCTLKNLKGLVFNPMEKI